MELSDVAVTVRRLPKMKMKVFRCDNTEEQFHGEIPIMFSGRIWVFVCIVRQELSDPIAILKMADDILIYSKINICVISDEMNFLVSK